MAFQASGINSAAPFIMGGGGIISDAETVLTQATRSVTLAQYTIMSYIAGSSKWTPWITGNLGDTTGLQYPSGIFMGDTILAATLAAGDVLLQPILVMGPCEVDFNQIVFDLGPTGILAALTLASVPTVPTSSAMQGWQYLRQIGIYAKRVYNVDTHEN
jgi:hypothetical protein